MGAGPEQDLPGLRLLLEAGRDVDGLAGGERRVAAVGDDLTRLDADARLEAELAHGLQDRQRGTNRTLGVVLVGLRNAEGGHHGVAGELLDLASVHLDALRDALEEPRHAAAHDLRIGARDQPGRVDQVHENDSCQLAFHPSSVETLRTARKVPAKAP